MRILVDTNILFSALLYKDSRIAKVLSKVCESHNHVIYLTDYNIVELKSIIKRKAPDILPVIDNFLKELPYELIPATGNATKKIRDQKDQPILNAAIDNDLDVILTGDKDFLSLDLARPRCLSVSDFYRLYGKTL